MAGSDYLSWLEKSKYRAVAWTLILFGIVSRFLFLVADPPGFFKKTSRAILTDPYNLTYFARNKVLFGSWDIFDYNRWMAFKYSVVSAASYLWFSLFGVSRLTANLSAVFLSVTGTALFSYMIYRKNRIAGLITALLLFCNVILNLYGRHPFLENGLIFLCGILFLIFCRYSDRWWGLILSAFLTALCVLSGKLFGLVMAAPVLLVILIQQRERFLAGAGMFIVSLAASLFFLAAIFYGSDPGIVYSYIAEQTVGMYGPPTALQSPFSFVEQMLTLGGSSLTYHFNPVLMIIMFIVSLQFMIRPDGMKLLRENRELLFLVGWLIAGFLLLSFPNYRPLRYQLFLFLPACGIIGFMLATPIDYGAERVKRKWFERAVVFLICWFFAEQIIMSILRPIQIDAPGLAYRMVWYSIPVAVALTGLLLYYRRGFLKLAAPRGLGLALVLVIYLVMQGQLSYRWFTERSYVIEEFGEDIVETLGEDAVMIGPYAQTITINSDVKSFIYMFGLSNEEPDLFKRFPFTHLAVDKPNLEAALKDYPELKGSLETVNGTLKYSFINIIQINDRVLNRAGTLYNPSEYEKGARFFGSDRPDRAEYHIENFLAKYPDNSQALIVGANHYAAVGNFERCRELLDRAKTIYPNDFSYLFEVAYLYYKVALLTNDVKARFEAESLFLRSAELYPDITDQIAKAKAQADAIFKK